jgi:hypothetical protein
MLGPGNAGSVDAADHIQSSDEAFGQIPEAELHGQPILVRCDRAGATKEWLTQLRRYRDQQGLDLRFSVGFTVTNQVKDAIAVLPESVWTVAVDAAGKPRPVDETGCGSWSAGKVLIPERRSACSKPTTVGATNAWPPTPAVDNCGSWKPGTAHAINAVWLQLALTAADLIAWTQTILLDGALAAAEPKKLRYQILHAAARIVHGQRKTRIKIDTG